jgi:hypothetical protein
VTEQAAGLVGVTSLAMTFYGASLLGALTAPCRSHPQRQPTPISHQLRDARALSLDRRSTRRSAQVRAGKRPT